MLDLQPAIATSSETSDPRLRCDREGGNGSTPSWRVPHEGRGEATPRPEGASGRSRRSTVGSAGWDAPHGYNRTTPHPPGVVKRTYESCMAKHLHRRGR